MKTRKTWLAMLAAPLLALLVFTPLARDRGASEQKLRQAAIDLVPQLAGARMLEAWAGLRPGTPDGLPILGATPTPGYFVATGHFRDGILLAPVTARLMGQVISGRVPDWDLGAFSAHRFSR